MRLQTRRDARGPEPHCRRGRRGEREQGPRRGSSTAGQSASICVKQGYGCFTQARVLVPQLAIQLRNSRICKMVASSVCTPRPVGAQRIRNTKAGGRSSLAPALERRSRSGSACCGLFAFAG